MNNIGSENIDKNFRTTTSISDPFNYPMLNRNNLMSLSNINKNLDGVKTSTVKFQSSRGFSSNLLTKDIDGKL